MHNLAGLGIIPAPPNSSRSASRQHICVLREQGKVINALLLRVGPQGAHPCELVSSEFCVPAVVVLFSDDSIGIHPRFVE